MMRKKIYFLTSCTPDFRGNGLAKRCAMWHYVLDKKGYDVVTKNYYEDTKNQKLVQILKTVRLPKTLINVINFLTSFLRRKAYIQNTIQYNEEVFIFRINPLLNFYKSELFDLLNTDKKVIQIDFDESEYASDINIFGLSFLNNYLRNKIHKIERFLANSDGIIKYVSSDLEKNHFSTYYGKVENIYIQPNMLLKKGSTKLKSKLQEPLRLLILGDYSYQPNQQMLVYLIKSLKSKELLDGFEFQIVGGGMENNLLSQFSQFSNVKVHGYLSHDNLVEMFNAVDFHFAPIFSGGGTKYKIIEALSYGVPTITTLKGMEGLMLMPYKHYIPYENFKDLNRLLNFDNSTYLAIQQNCLDLFNNSFALEK